MKNLRARQRLRGYEQRGFWRGFNHDTVLALLALLRLGHPRHAESLLASNDLDEHDLYVKRWCPAYTRISTGAGFLR